MTDYQAYPNESAYLEALFPESNEIKSMRAYAAENHIPVVVPEVARTLKMIAALKKPAHILELGTAIGLSTLTLAQAAPAASITSIEINEKRYADARRFLVSYLTRGQVQLLQGDIRSDAFWTSAGLEDQVYDLIFIDAAKGQYAALADRLWQHVSPGGLMIFDDVLQHGWVATLAYPNHRQKTAVLRLRQFLEDVAASGRGHVLNIDDGVLLLIKE